MSRAVRLARALLQAIAVLAVASAAGVVHAAGCELSIDANDLLQFSTRTLQADAACSEVQLTLRHTGQQGVHVIGHDWVLARPGDVNALVGAGLRAGADHGYLPPGDARVLAATKLVGGGESASVTFSTAGLAPGEYAFFCTYPGHAPLMRGKFLLAPRLASTATGRGG